MDNLILNEAFVWDAARGMRSIRDVLVNEFGLGASLAGWQLYAAIDVSGDGSIIVGSGVNPAGRPEGWIASLVPEPSACATLVMGSFLAGGRVRRPRHVMPGVSLLLG
jgi:hypothetical protein